MVAFQAGSRVYLKSGSDEMTIRFVEGDEAVCEWFIKGEIKTHRFKLAQLKLSDDSSDD
jgi:uncharacterized protein YodC (DUF2158 family)